jgi:protein ImuB
MPWWDAEAQTEERPQPEQTGPLVLVTHGAKGTRISGLDAEGMAQGFWLDMKLNDARAMMPELRVVTHDVVADRLLQKKLARWMLRYSPSVALHGDDSFLLDVAGCAHLFGGEDAMAQNICSRFAAMGFDCRLAFADTPAAAIAIVLHGADEIFILPVGAPKTMLDALPVEALRLDDETITILKRLGLKLIGDVRPLPRAALERRFREKKKHKSKAKALGLAQSVQWRLDQLTGRVREPLSWITEPQAFRATKQCPALALEHGAVEIALNELLPVLCEQLQMSAMGARHYRLTGYRADGGTSFTAISLSQPGHDPKAIARLFKDRLEQIDCGFGIDLFTLEASQVSSLEAAQHDGFDDNSTAFASASIAAFADTLTNRSDGAQAFRLLPRQSHVPERAQQSVPVYVPTDWKHRESSQPVWSPRPLRLLDRPERARVTAELPDSPPAQFVWRKRLRKVIRARGPERILPEWWQDDFKAKRSAVFRDYYDVEDETGLRYWMFRAIRDEPIEGKKDTQRVINWFVHGLF